MRRYFIGFLVTIGLIILLIVLIAHGGGNKSKVPATSASLQSYATTDAVARLTIDGPINAPQDHTKVQISVSKDNTTFEILQGYDGNVTTSKSYGNTEASYDAFLHALERAGFTKGNTSSTLQDEGGYCSTGDRYIYELIQNGKDLERYWATNCMSEPKSFNGSVSLNNTLFKAQVHDYGSLTENVSQ